MLTEYHVRTIEPDIDLIDISGRLNMGNTLQALENSILGLIEKGSRKLVVNLTQLSFIDSAGIGVLISCNGQMEQNRGKIRFAGAQGFVARTFQVVHMRRVAALDPDVDTACRNLAG
jgi:anti-sigma B factor antagonist